MAKKKAGGRRPLRLLRQVADGAPRLLLRRHPRQGRRKVRGAQAMTTAGVAPLEEALAPHRRAVVVVVGLAGAVAVAVEAAAAGALRLLRPADGERPTPTSVSRAPHVEAVAVLVPLVAVVSGAVVVLTAVAGVAQEAAAVKTGELSNLITRSRSKRSTR